MIVIEDVDLIARSREALYGPRDQTIPPKILKGMDGLRKDAASRFILTTNRLASLETALASRPWRIDQSIEYPPPDENPRRLLARLCSCGLPLYENLAETNVRRTEKASAAFLKELTRRAASSISRTTAVTGICGSPAALEEMLFTGGSLNSKLLGAAEVSSTTVQ